MVHGAIIMSTFFVIVKAKKNGRVLDETVLEFSGSHSEKKIETEINIVQEAMQKTLNTKDLGFSYQYANTEQESKSSQIWKIAGKGNYVMVK